jgi:hypothetical protein
MLLGCCHCGETPSESTPPSVSQSLPPSDSASESMSASASASYGIVGCNACDGNVMPARYTIATSKIAGSLYAGCNAEYTGNFAVYHTPSGLSPLPSAGTPSFPDIGGTDCRFYSTDLALKFRTATCLASANPSGRRFTLAIVRTNLGGSFRYALTVNIQYWVDFGFGASSETMSYSVQQDDLVLPGDNAFNCLGTFSLPFTTGARTLAQTGFPSSITVTPG